MLNLLLKTSVVGSSAEISQAIDTAHTTKSHLPQWVLSLTSQSTTLKPATDITS